MHGRSLSDGPVWEVVPPFLGYPNHEVRPPSLPTVVFLVSATMPFSARHRCPRSILLLPVLALGGACGDDEGSQTASGTDTTGMATATATATATDSSPTGGTDSSSPTTGTSEGTGSDTASTDTSTPSSTSTSDGTAETDSTSGTGTADTSGTDTDAGTGTDTGDTGETGNPDAPGPVIDLRALPSDASAYVVWGLPDDPDLAGVLVARSTDPVDVVPVDGMSYGLGDPLGNAEVVFATDGLNVLDLPLDNGTTYHYRAWAFDLDFNYSVSSADDATPQDSRATMLTDHSVPVGGTIDSARVAFDDAIQPHVALRVETGGPDELRYATCDSGCDEASDWDVALVDTAPSNRPAIALDGDGRPRMAYPRGSTTYFARCDANCGAGANWSTVQLTGTSAGTVLVDVDANGRTWVVSGNSQLEISWCDNGCTNAANWTTIIRPGSYFYKHELLHSSTDVRVLVVSRYDANYTTRLLTCTGACEDPNDWSEETIGSTAGSVYTLEYRFTADELGARTLFPYDGRYRECEDCAPGLPPVVYDFTSTEVYYGGALRLSAEDQARMFARQSSGGMDYLLCDYDCTSPANWITVDEAISSGEVLLGFELDDDGMPIAIARPYSNPTTLLLQRGVTP